MTILVIAVCLSSAGAAEEPWKPTGKETPASMKARTTAINRPKAVGTYYKATVPDTLDLAEPKQNHFQFMTEANTAQPAMLVCSRPPGSWMAAMPSLPARGGEAG